MKKTPKKLTIDEIHELVEQFGEATLRGKKAGFDGVQFHGAHGYLITQFYSPYLNLRDDEYGGNTENRARFPIEILKSSRKKVGANFPITLKMNATDKIEGGLELTEACTLAKMFANEGYDALEISSYIHEAGLYEKPPDRKSTRLNSSHYS